jgi:hypothetical protein
MLSIDKRNAINSLRYGFSFFFALPRVRQLTLRTNANMIEIAFLLHTFDWFVEIHTISVSFHRFLFSRFWFFASVPIEFDDIDSAYDLDTEQSEARYDPRLLSQELQSSDMDSQGAAESCVNANRSYEHGAKVSGRL